MIINIFSIFDSNIYNIPINKVIILTIILTSTINHNTWVNKNKKTFIINKIYLIIKKSNKNNFCLIEIFTNLATILITINLINLIPNIISISRIITNNVVITIILWINIIIINFKNIKVIIINISPKNTPIFIIWIINIIELNRIMFQIISLSIRLSINIIIGHIIINLINKTLTIFIYLPIELFVILIQSYIFITLNIINFRNLN